MKRFAFLCLIFLWPHWSVAQIHCDPGLSKPPEDPYGYSLIHDRCEGRYFQEVSSTSLALVSLTDYFETYDLESPSPLVLEWTLPPQSQNIKLRAASLQRRVYYRMDSERKPSETSYSWSIVMLNRLGLERRDLGVVGWTQTPLAPGKNVYTPLRIGQQSRSDGDGRYRLLLVPGRELREVYFSLAGVDRQGNPANYIQDGQRLGGTVYPAGRPFPILIEDLPSAGVYFVEVGATLRGGGTTDIGFWLYHAGP